MSMLRKKKNSSVDYNANAFSSVMTSEEKIDRKIMESYALSFLEKIALITPYEGRGQEAYIAALQDLEDEPKLIHYIIKDSDENLYDMLSYVNAKGWTSAFYDMLTDIGMEEIAIARYSEQEPLCFKLFGCKNINVLETVNKYFTNKGIDPVNVKGKKWSAVYEKKMSEIYKEASSLDKNFKKTAEVYSKNL